MTPFDLKTKEEWDEVLDRFAADTNMTACLTDPEGNHYQCRFDRYPVCTAIRANQDSLTYICSQTNTAMVAVVAKTKKPETDLCEAGMIRTVVPIVRDGETIGLVSACGMASDEEEIDDFLVSKELGISEEEAAELIKGTPSVSEDKISEISDKLYAELNGG